VFKASARDPIHAGFFVVTAYVVMAIWWFVWALNEKETWNFLEFLLMMGSPIALYLAAHLLVSDNPSRVLDWRAHFGEIRQWYFAACLVTVVLAITRSILVLGGDFAFAAGLSVMCLAFVVGILSESRRVHTAILSLWLVFQIFAVSQRFTAT
jgi:hypothetical protein